MVMIIRSQGGDAGEPPAAAFPLPIFHLEKRNLVSGIIVWNTHACMYTNVRYGPPPHRDGARGDIGFLNFHMLFQDGSYALFRKGKEVRITNCDSRYMKDRNWTAQLWIYKFYRYFFSMATTSRNQWAPKISTFARQVRLGCLGLGSTRRSKSTSRFN